MKSRKNPRLQDRDYSRPGGYYITICTKNMVRYFGEVVNEKMQLNELGKQVQKCWHEIPEHHPHVELDTFVCMPNHIHGIIFITEYVETKYLWSDKQTKSSPNRMNIHPYAKILLHEQARNLNL